MQMPSSDGTAIGYSMPLMAKPKNGELRLENCVQNDKLSATGVGKTNTVKLYSYVVARDYGFAPNPFFGFCTLATCKPEIRKAAAIDDWVIGTGSKRQNRGNR